MSVTVYATPARGARNGLTVKPYVYRGRGYDVLTPEMDECWCTGTNGAYFVHLSAGETPCGPSRAGHAAKEARNRERKKQARQ